MSDLDRIRRLGELGDDVSELLRRAEIRRGLRRPHLTDMLRDLAAASRTSRRIEIAAQIVDAMIERGERWSGPWNSRLLHVAGVCSDRRWHSIGRTEALRRLAAGRICTNCRIRMMRWREG